MPERFQPIFEQATVTMHGATRKVSRWIEVLHPRLSRYVIIRQNGTCLLLTRRRSNTLPELLEGTVHTDHRNLPDSDSDEEEENFF